MSSAAILVTGGAGYIGSHACKALAQEGFTPIAFDNLVLGHRDAVRWGPLVEADIRDEDAVGETIRKYAIEAVIHFAAFAYVGESVGAPAKYYRNNVGGTLSLLDACRSAGVDKLVFSSSCATYGVPDVLPITEAAPQRPINPYGRTKLVVEQVLADYAHAYGSRHIALRYFNAAGADPDGEIGERHDPETHLIPLALLAAAGRREALEVFGEDYDTPDGTCIRDYIHVTDLARAHVLALRHLLDGGDSLALNLGSGSGSSIREVIGSVEHVTGRKVPHVTKPRRPGDPPVLYADPSLAKERLGFETELSDLNTIVGTAAAFLGLEARG
jgi:UDP-arabinose 4-epimerase